MGIFFIKFAIFGLVGQLFQGQMPKWAENLYAAPGSQYEENWAKNFSFFEKIKSCDLNHNLWKFEKSNFCCDCGHNFWNFFKKSPKLWPWSQLLKIQKNAISCDWSQLWVIFRNLQKFLFSLGKGFKSCDCGHNF